MPACVWALACSDWFLVVPLLQDSHPTRMQNYCVTWPPSPEAIITYTYEKT